MQVPFGELHWTMECRQRLARFGSSLGAGGDFNGDGLKDLLVGVQRYDDAQGADSGMVMVFPGGLPAFSLLNFQTLRAPRPGLEFGHLVGSAGDVNRDGYSDAFVTALKRGIAGGEEERMFLFMGSRTGLVSAAAWEATGPHSNAVFAGSVASAGDVNGDGFADLIVGVRDGKRAFQKEGAALVYLGSKFGFGSKPDWEYWGGEPNARFGTRVAAAGDVNGDGFADVLVGSPSCCGSNRLGRVWLFLGSGQGISTRKWRNRERTIARACGRDSPRTGQHSRPSPGCGHCSGSVLDLGAGQPQSCWRSFFPG